MCTVRDLEPGIVHGSHFNPSALDSVKSDIDLNEDFEEPRDLTEDVELKLASVLLKLERLPAAKCSCKCTP